MKAPPSGDRRPARLGLALLAVLGGVVASACGDTSPNAAAPRPPEPPRARGGTPAAGPVSALAVGPMDPAPVLAFSQVASAVGIDRRREPASAGTFSAPDTLAYGAWLADLDGDGRLDYYGVNHGQYPHSSGLFINDGAGRFGLNLFTVAVGPAAEDPADLGRSNEVTFVGDLTGDGRVDLFFRGWAGLGTLCVNQGAVGGVDWAGPSFACYGTGDALAFADVNGDGRIDVLSVDPAQFDTYTAYYANAGTFLWRLNNGDPDIQKWPTTRNFLELRVTDPSSPAAPFLDLNGDTIPDKIVGVPLPAGSRGPYGTSTAGKQVYLGQAGGTYALQSATGLENVVEPITAIEDVNGDGCLDVGTDQTGYRDNQNWYVQGKVNGRCSLKFTFVARTALPYFPGFKRYAVDLDNSGLLSQVVIVHGAYGNNDGRPVGVIIHRKLADGSYVAIPPAESGIDITAGGYEFYADNLSPGDWNDDGRLDLAGSGVSNIPGTDAGFALWTSRLASSNGWLKITLPTVTGFFAGAAKIEVFDAGFVGDGAHVVTPPRVLYTGRTWASQVHHLGIGTRSAVDVRVTFPDGKQVVRAGVAPGSRLAITPAPPAQAVAVASASPTSALLGEPVTFDGSASTATPGSVVEFAWDFGDGSTGAGATARHAYATAGTFVATLRVTSDQGATSAASVTVVVRDERPDLLVTALDAPASAAPGSTVTVLATVRNGGAGAAGPFRVGIYLSADATVTGADVLLGTITVAGLQAGASSSQATLVTVPASAIGSWVLGAIADDEGVVGERDETNNARGVPLGVAYPLPVAVATVNPASPLVGDPVSFDGSSSTVAAPGKIVAYAWDFGDGTTGAGATTSHAYAVRGTFVATLRVTDDHGGTGAATVTVAVRDERPDLRVTALDAPATAVPGTTVTVLTTVTNGGTAAAGPFRVGIYLSSDATVTSSDLLIGTITVAGLEAGASSADGALVTIPPGATGSWVLGAIADDQGAVREIDETNNGCAAPLAVAYLPPVAVAKATPASPLLGEPVAFDGSSSIGVAPASIVGWAWDFGDGTTGAGATASHAYLSAGSFVATLRVTDDRGGASTASVTVVVVAADLLVAGLEAPASAAPGTTMTVVTTVQNGGAAAAGPFRVGLYLSADPNVTASDALIGTVTIDRLEAGEIRADATIVSIPAVAAGTWYLGAIADDQGVVVESDETNNGGMIPLSVAEPSRPDLTVVTLSAPGSATAGTSVTVRTTITNLGTGAAPGAQATFYLSVDPARSADDVVLGDRVVPALAPGASSSGATAVLLPAGLAPGKYYLLAVVDPAGAVAESDETNNVRYVAVSVKRAR